mmetsp:Transcript_38084/g.58114  ORF Transcript_38084/g.58114 Transcript_38084/m.58114 type:complete len:132 (-) Transcript_38084:350-745(-)
MLDTWGKKLVARMVQTNVLELLGVDDLIPLGKDSRRMKDSKLRGIHFDEDYGLEDDLDETTNLISKSLVNNVLSNFEGFQEKKKRKKLPPARVRQLPVFEISDIIGDFEIDEEGNFIIIKNGLDKKGGVVL